MKLAIIKNEIYKYGMIICCLVVTFILLIKVEGFDALDALRVLLGGYPLGRVILVLIFVMCIALVQYVNLDPIMCLLKSNTYLLVRYKDRKTIFYRLLVNVFCLNVIFISTVVVAFVISILICNIEISQVDRVEILELCVRGLLMCLCCSLIQIFSMIKWDEANTFMIMTVISIFSAFISRINIGIFTIFPVRLPIKELILNIILCFVYIISGMFFCSIIYQRKGAE